MKKFTKLAFTGLLLACASTGYAGGGGHADRVCIPVDGTVTTTPIACELILPGGPPSALSSNPWGTVQWLPQCFLTEGKGKARFSGSSQLTMEVVQSLVPEAYIPPPLAPLSLTPLTFPSEAVRSQLNVFTSNAMLTGKIRNYTGTLYTKDTGVITVDITPGGEQTVGQVLKIVGGSPGSDFEGATGMIAVAGQEVGGGAFYTGEVCVKPKK